MKKRENEINITSNKMTPKSSLGVLAKNANLSTILRKYQTNPNWGTFDPENLISSLGKCKGRGARPLVLGLCGNSEFWLRQQQQTRNDSGTSSRMQKIRGSIFSRELKSSNKTDKSICFLLSHVWAILNSVPDKTLLPRRKNIFVCFSSKQLFQSLWRFNNK